MGETELSKFGVGMSVPITIEQDQLVCSPSIRFKTLLLTAC